MQQIPASSRNEPWKCKAQKPRPCFHTPLGYPCGYQRTNPWGDCAWISWERSLCQLKMALIPLRSGSPRGRRCEMEREKRPWGATTELLNTSSFHPGIKLGKQHRPAEGKLKQLLRGAVWREYEFPTKKKKPHQIHNSSSSPLPSFSSPHTMFAKRAGAGGAEEPVPLKCCLLQTVQRISVINSLSQAGYFWSGLRGGNLLESSSFILRFTVLPFPAGRGEKWNHMFGGASGGNPSEDKWLLLSPGNSSGPGRVPAQVFPTV